MEENKLLTRKVFAEVPPRVVFILMRIRVSGEKGSINGPAKSVCRPKVCPPWGVVPNFYKVQRSFLLLNITLYIMVEFAANYKKKIKKPPLVCGGC